MPMLSHRREVTTIGIGRHICGFCDKITPTLIPEEPLFETVHLTEMGVVVIKYGHIR